MSAVATGAGAGIEFGPVGMLIGGLIGLGVTILGAEAISNANTKADNELKSDTQAQVCTDCGDDPDCEQRAQQITDRMNELKQRFAEMREDKYGLYNINPEKIPGVGNWDGHQDQFQYKQANLRKQIKQAQTKGCSVPPDAWYWATLDPPSKPAP